MEKKAEGQYIYGIHPVTEAIRSGKEIEFVLVQVGLRGQGMQELGKLLSEKKVLVKNVPIQKLNQLTKSNHQGVIALVAQVESAPIEEIVATAFERGEVPLILVLDKITDTRNLGAIARTAESAGVHAIVLPTSGSAQINADTVKTSAGALNYIPICKVRNLTDAVVYLKTAGLQIVAATEKTPKYYYDLDFCLPTAIIMGSEDTGVSPNLIKLCDSLAKIPMLGKTSSLNVSVAAAILIYESVRQRKSKN